MLDVLVVVVALAVSVFGGWLLTIALLRGVRRVDPTPTTLRGGAWIGVLERVAITGCLIA